MQATNQSASAKPLSIRINRVLYGAFVLLSLYFFLNGSYQDAASNLGLALIFDPFNQMVRWENRPRWQRAWLLVHLLVMAGIGLVYWKTFSA
ncbi:hypothetical protein EXU85_02795 [Spirosoma sp. KCTC 42546]|uniref:hypothetical protein n=1 Tax=Spirosoma sp. KCTC 42546 TaxID=2520506 RepID=UPI00115BDDFF|nr:hypothetical protein [Spirosoma sp. KCTC 42546]QDK77578.1 hypothetical protein EXU85_02795 [Spirosoma sp. KCTC 42546]